MSRAQEILAGREAIGWKLGLERMRRLCSLLGMPQHRFASVHVVGTNGKTSVALMTAALVQAHGVRAGAYVSPHIGSWRERIMIGGEPVSEAAFERALERVEEAARAADRAAGEEGPVTQFELVTAAAFWALADAGVQVAAVEAGLGGRLDATNVIPSAATVLTSVGLDHTEWLGETLEEIAAEKLAVVRDHSTLISGEVPDSIVPLIDAHGKSRHAEVIWAVGRGGGEGPALGFQAANLSLARAAAEAVLGRFDAEAVSTLLRSGNGLRVPGRAELVGGEPPLVFDAAHNPDGARALAQMLPALAGGREVVCCLAILAEKDARSMIEALGRACSAFVCTEVPERAVRGSGRPSARSHPATRLAEHCRAVGARAEALADPVEAWARARALARERNAVALAAGSHYLLSCIWTERHAASS